MWPRSKVEWPWGQPHRDVWLSLPINTDVLNHISVFNSQYKAGFAKTFRLKYGSIPTICDQASPQEKETDLVFLKDFELILM